MMDKSCGDSSYICKVCEKPYIDAVGIECGHNFCSYCLSLWRKYCQSCPTCSKRIGKITPLKTLDKEIEGFFQRSREPGVPQERAREISERREVATKFVKRCAANTTQAQPSRELKVIKGPTQSQDLMVHSERNPYGKAGNGICTRCSTAQVSNLKNQQLDSLNKSINLAHKELFGLYSKITDMGHRLISTEDSLMAQYISRSNEASRTTNSRDPDLDGNDENYILQIFGESMFSASGRPSTVAGVGQGHHQIEGRPNPISNGKALLGPRPKTANVNISLKGNSDAQMDELIAQADDLRKINNTLQKFTLDKLLKDDEQDLEEEVDEESDLKLLSSCDPQNQIKKFREIREALLMEDDPLKDEDFELGPPNLADEKLEENDYAECVPGSQSRLKKSLRKLDALKVEDLEPGPSINTKLEEIDYAGRATGSQSQLKQTKSLNKLDPPLKLKGSANETIPLESTSEYFTSICASSIIKDHGGKDGSHGRDGPPKKGDTTKMKTKVKESRLKSVHVHPIPAIKRGPKPRVHVPEPISKIFKMKDPKVKEALGSLSSSRVLGISKVMVSTSNKPTTSPKLVPLPPRPKTATGPTDNKSSKNVHGPSISNLKIKPSKPKPLNPLDPKPVEKGPKITSGVTPKGEVTSPKLGPL